MAAGIDAVIAALRVVLEEAQKSNAPQAKANAANCWINRLPGAWTGRWRKLVVPANSSGEIPRGEFIGHVRAVLAYLETSSRDPAPAQVVADAPAQRGATDGHATASAAPGPPGKPAARTQADARRSLGDIGAPSMLKTCVFRRAVL